MKRGVTFVVLVLTSVAATVWAKSERLPSTYPICKLSDPKYDECHLKATEAAFRLLKNGIPSLKVLPIDPLHVKEIDLMQGSGSIQLTMMLKDVSIYGISDAKFTSAGDDIAQGGVNMWSESLIPKMEMISNYEVDGRILVFPLTGTGRSNVTLTNVKVVSKMVNEKVTVNGEEFIKCKEYITKMTPGNVNFQLGNLLGGDATLGRELNNVINENWRELYKESGKTWETTFGEVFKQIANQLLLKVPYKTMFLHD